MVRAGSRLGPYEIVSPIGAGGMGEVWRAKDTRLDRSVAIKVLPAAFAENAQLKLRFEREAKSISQLNHPHICTLHDVGSEEGISYLVMELIDGETLADRIARGPLPLPDVLRYGAEIAGALDAAHRAGIIHRDLKPGNIMLTKSGAKLLDFGLARSTAPVVTMDDPTQHRPLTQEGTILGTFQYMAPEQLEGLEADARTDIFAFGAVLHEMATGRRAFEGKTRTSLIAAIVGGEPKPISASQPMAPAALQHVIAKCLEKDPEERWQSARDLADELHWVGTATDAGPSQPKGGGRWVLAALATLLLLSMATAGYLFIRQKKLPALETALNTEANSGPDVFSGPPVFSPDGKLLLYSTRDARGRRMLWLRRLDNGRTDAISGTEDGSDPFWSPDGQQVGFTAGKLRRVSLNGGDSEVLADSDGTGGGTWNSDGVILFAAAAPGPVLRASSAGGDPTPVTDPAKQKHRAHRWPLFLPDGRHFLYLALPLLTDDRGKSALYMASLDGKDAPRFITNADTNALYVNGTLLFSRDGVLRGQSFDPRNGKLGDNSSSVAPLESFTPNNVAMFAATEDCLAYQPQGGSEHSRLVIKNRSGEVIRSLTEPSYYWSPRLSNDGSRIAVDKSDERTGSGDIWIVPVNGGSASRFTFEDTNETAPVWAPDGSAVAYSMTMKQGGGRPVVKPIAGTTVKPVLPGGEPGYAIGDWSSAGSGEMVFSLLRGTRGSMDVLLRMAEDGKLVQVAATPANESAPRLSPDGKWVAYQSNETGRMEVYVQPVPPNGAKYQISPDGGGTPCWRKQGEIVYVGSDSRFTTVSVDTAGEFRTSPPQVLFQGTMREGGFAAQFDVMPDGSILVNESIGNRVASMTLLVNWKSRLDAKK
jgi:serine/threonine protein kinase